MVEVQNGSIKRISVDQVGRQADGDSSAAAICDYGRQVAFQSEATNLVPDDTNGACEIFVAEEVGVHAVTLASGQTAAGLDFGNQIQANVFVVNSTSDPGDGVGNALEFTVREAINAANTAPNLREPDRIVFNLPAADPRHFYYYDDAKPGCVSLDHIRPTAAESDSMLVNPDPDWPHSWFSIQLAPGLPLPAILDSAVIDGYFQPGAHENANSVESGLGLNSVLMIELDGSRGGTGGGLALDAPAGHSIVRGLVIDGFDGPGSAITLVSGDSNIIEGNFLGTDPSGAIARGNLGGLLVGTSGSSMNRIGGPRPMARNLISGNAEDGIRIVSSYNLVQGNLVGIDRTGMGALGNGGHGAEIASDSNQLGGIIPGEQNVLSANGLAGVFLTGNQNLVQGNLIGAAISGVTALGNATDGVWVSGSGNVVGGTDADDRTSDGLVLARNVISGNQRNGLLIDNATDTRVQGNFIGAELTGGAMGNRLAGVVVVLSRGTLIGGTDPGAGNCVAHSGGDGVRVESFGGHTVLGNSIFANAGPGIDLGADDGPTPNDPGDADTGANDLQNYPVLTGVARRAADTRISGTLNSTPATSFWIEFFSTDLLDPSGFGEGRTALGSVNVSTDAHGEASFIATLPVFVDANGFIAATATGPAGSTSEFSLGSPVTLQDLDGDESSYQQEDAAPNGGDGNDDGMLDRQQAYVTSLQSTVDPYVTLVVSEDLRFTGVRAIPNPDPDHAPEGVGFPVGFLAFQIGGVPAGGAVTLRLLVHGGESIDGFWKYGPTPGNPQAHWYDFLFDGTTGVEIVGSVATLHLIDGLRGDDDLMANGIIVGGGAPSRSSGSNHAKSFDVNGPHR